MISRSSFNKLVEHNFLTGFDADELSRLTDNYSRNFNLLSNLQLLIESIHKIEIDYPLGIFNSDDIYTTGGKYSFKTKKFTFSGSDKVEYTLEELEFYYKLVHLLTHMAT